MLSLQTAKFILKSFSKLCTNFILRCSKASQSRDLIIIFLVFLQHSLSIFLVYRCQKKLCKIDGIRFCTHHATSTHLSPFRPLIRLRRCSFISTSSFSTILFMQLSSTRERVFDLISCLQIGHSTLRFVHSLIQQEQKLCAQFRVTACGIQQKDTGHSMLAQALSSKSILSTGKCQINILYRERDWRAQTLQGLLRSHTQTAPPSHARGQASVTSQLVESL